MKSRVLIVIIAIFAYITPKDIIADTIPVGGGIITGMVHYTNAAITPMRQVRVLISDEQGLPLDTVYTNAEGEFTFHIADSGTYTLSASPFHPCGGFNAVDALLILQHFTGIIALQGLELKAADVNLSNSVNSIDALLVQRRFVELISSFPATGWISETVSITLGAADSAYTSFGLICAGDVNASYIPANNIFLVCGDTLIDERDQQKYPTVQIGSQCWMQRNLNYGQIIPLYDEMTDNGIGEKKCLWNSQSQCDIWGAYYDWNELMQYDTTEGIQGLCPSGWHVPSYADCLTLQNFLGGESVAGHKMRVTGTVYWEPPNLGATNESGFTALGSGGLSGSQGMLSYHWCSKYCGFECAMMYSLHNNSPTMEILPGVTVFFAFPVRCMKDE